MSAVETTDGAAASPRSTRVSVVAVANGGATMGTVVVVLVVVVLVVLVLVVVVVVAGRGRIVGDRGAGRRRGGGLDRRWRRSRHRWIGLASDGITFEHDIPSSAAERRAQHQRGVAPEEELLRAPCGQIQRPVDRRRSVQMDHPQHAVGDRDDPVAVGLEQVRLVDLLLLVVRPDHDPAGGVGPECLGRYRRRHGRRGGAFGEPAARHVGGSGRCVDLIVVASSREPPAIGGGPHRIHRCAQHGFGGIAERGAARRCPQHRDGVRRRELPVPRGGVPVGGACRQQRQHRDGADRRQARSSASPSWDLSCLLGRSWSGGRRVGHRGLPLVRCHHLRRPPVRPGSRSRPRIFRCRTGVRVGSPS